MERIRYEEFSAAERLASGDYKPYLRQALGALYQPRVRALLSLPRDKGLVATSVAKAQIYDIY